MPTAVPNPADPATCVDTANNLPTPTTIFPFGPKAAVLGINGSSPTPTITLWSDPIQTNPLYDTAGNPPIETWEFWNHTVDAHPIHVHEVKFKVLNREAFDPATGLSGAVRPPEATEAGWKDTVIALPGDVTRIAATFDLPGLYVWHCHIVEHEDNEMMVPYCTGNMDPAKGPIANGCQALLPAQLYLSLEAGGTLTGLGPNGTNLVFADEDILSWNGANYAMVFDGSAAGLSATADVSAFDIDHANNRILMAFNSTQYLRGIGWITGSDIVAYDLVKKTFSLVFDGSDVGLVTATELLDAIEFLPDGRLIVSTNGSTSVPSGGPVALAAVDQDLLVFTPATLGSATTGTWAVYFDGSDVGLATVGEGVNGASVAKNGDIYLSTVGSFAVTALSGQNEDVFVCKTPTTGPDTACTGGFSLFFDGTTKGLGTNIVDAIDLP